ncbi:gamma-glutamylcyclotransferase family protein [Maricaulaceae bacterium MS644]
MAGGVVRAGDLIAVYGLLRAGQSGFAQFGLAHAFRDAGPCVLKGELWDLGRYPGLVDGEGRVLGELFEVMDPSVMARLDVFEDYWPGDPARSRYERRKVQLAEPDREAWVYVWILGLNDARRIESGDWLNR